MTRLNELLNDEKSIFVFDVDGVLAKMNLEIIITIIMKIQVLIVMNNLEML